MRNAVIDHSRRRGTAQKAFERFATELEHESPNEEAHRTVCACVSELAGTLNPEYASALKRIEVDGVSVKEFAVEAGVFQRAIAHRDGNDPSAPHRV